MRPDTELEALRDYIVKVHIKMDEAILFLEAVEGKIKELNENAVIDNYKPIK